MTFRLLLCLLAVLAPTGPADASDITGAARVHDGDTIRIGDRSIRIWGIDAVELKQSCVHDGASVPCGVMSREALKAIIGNNTVTCTPKGRSYKRMVGICRVNGRDIAEEMARMGMAFDYPHYSRARYAAAEATAKEARAGLWAMRAEPPAHWRACNLKQRRAKRPDDCQAEF